MAISDPQPGVPTPTGTLMGAAMFYWSGSAWLPSPAPSGGTGTVTSVAGTGTVSGLTLTGTVTTTGSLTLGGTLSAISLTAGVSGILPGANGGTGVANTGSTITLGGNLITSGAFATTLTTTGTTNVTLPTSGALGFRNLPQNIQSAAYTTVLADSGGHILHPSADTTARIWTIDKNATVAYPIGTAITFVNQISGGVITIAIDTDTMWLAGAGTTGNRTLAANGVATALKITSAGWIISGTGLT